jgi:flagellar assembly protein FliH
VVDAAALQRAREQGYQEGFAAARQQGGAEADAQRADLKALVDGINELMRDFEQGLANDVLSMSLELSKLIVRSSLRVKPDLVISVVREAVAILPGISDQTVLHVNPADAVLLRQLAASDAQLKELPWRIVEDPQLERGGCRLATPATEVDASLETRWRRVIASLGRDDAWIDITI